MVSKKGKFSLDGRGYCRPSEVFEHAWNSKVFSLPSNESRNDRWNVARQIYRILLFDLCLPRWAAYFCLSVEIMYGAVIEFIMSRARRHLLHLLCDVTVFSMPVRNCFRAWLMATVSPIDVLLASRLPPIERKNIRISTSFQRIALSIVRYRTRPWS